MQPAFCVAEPLDRANIGFCLLISYSVIIISITLNSLQDTQHNHKAIDYLPLWQLWRHIKKRKFSSKYAQTLMVSFTSRLP